VSTTTVNAAALEVSGDAAAKTGINALRKTDIFNLLVIPPLTTSATANDTPTTPNDVPMSIWTSAATLCKEQRAFLVVDAPSDWTIAKAVTDGVGGMGAMIATVSPRPTPARLRAEARRLQRWYSSA